MTLKDLEDKYVEYLEFVLKQSEELEDGGEELFLRKMRVTASAELKELEIRGIEKTEKSDFLREE